MIDQADLPFSAVVFQYVTLGLAVIGLALLWYWQFRPSARAERATLRVPHNPAPWLYFGVMCVMVIIAGVLVQGAFVTSCRWFFKNMDLQSDFGMMLGTGALDIGLIGGALYARRFTNILQMAPGAIPPPASMPKPAEPIAVKNIIPVGIGVFFICLGVLTVISLFWNWALSRFGVSPLDQNLVRIFRDETSMTRLGIMITIAVVLAPVMEELVFRGGLFGYLRTRMPRAVAIIATGLIFSLSHLPFNVAAFPLLFALGVIFSMAYERTGRISVPIIAHALINLNTIVSILLGLRNA